MGFLNNLLHGPAVLAMKTAEPETPTIKDSMPEAISWPTDAEFAGYANGMYCREYAVRVVVDFISRQLASLPLKVYRKNADGDAEEVRDGALAKLIRHPSELPGMSRYRFYLTLIRDMLLEDRGCARSAPTERATGTRCAASPRTATVSRRTVSAN